MPASTIGKELKRYRERLKITLAEMAATLGVSTTTIVNYETGKRMPDIDFLIDFAGATGEDFLYWLGLRVGENRSAAAKEIKARLDAVSPSEGRTGDAFVSLPLYDIKDAANAALASGHGRVADEMLQFSTTWIERELNAAPADLFLIYMDDESMEPTLRPGDTILLDRRAAKPDREGVYILQMNGVPMVKRLQILPGGIVKVVSDNPAYETFTTRLSDINGQDFAILGRVVWVVWAGRRI
jgi:phage repressor protein C with HTH and peptisase S24 domain